MRSYKIIVGNYKIRIPEDIEVQLSPWYEKDGRFELIPHSHYGENFVYNATDIEKNEFLEKYRNYQL